MCSSDLYGDTNYQDMQLMIHCKHNIMCNSTFSWWGVWLNQIPDRVVIYPKKWLNYEYSNNMDEVNIFYDEWIGI